jgi:hypothetical protein
VNPDQARIKRVADHLLQASVAGREKLVEELNRRGIPAEHQRPVLEMAEKQLLPLLRQPMRDNPVTRSRWMIEWCRSFALAVLVLLWFFLVPVPGLTVFTAGSQPERYRFTLALGNIVATVGWAVVIVLVASWVSAFVQWLDFGISRRRGLRQRLEACFAGLKTLPATLSHAELSGAFALLTDSQTYLDQRSYAFARQSIEQAENVLIGAAKHKKGLS